MNTRNFFILIIVIILVSFGLVMIYSSSSVYAQKNFGTPNYFLSQQALWLLVGIFAFIFTYKLPYSKWKILSKPLLIFSIFILFLTLSPIGVEVNNAQRWIRVAGFTFQPAEFARLAFIIYVADFLSRKKYDMHSLVKGIFPLLLILLVITGPLILQPDFGTAVIIAFITIVLIFIGGGSPIYISSFFLISLPILYHLIFNVAYRRRRIFTFLNPYHDPQGAGYQLIHALIAVGSGQIFGRGLGDSTQKLFFLPASYTDFIFSITAEELGFIGASAIILLYVAFIFLGMSIIMKQKDEFGFLLGSGIILLIGIQAFINIGVSIGLLPTKGLPLPFISYGGSSLVVSLASVGILLNIGKNLNEE